MEITIIGIEAEDDTLYLKLRADLDNEAHDFRWDVFGRCFAFDCGTPWTFKNILHDNAQHPLMTWVDENVSPEISGLAHRLSARFAETRIGF